MSNRFPSALLLSCLLVFTSLLISRGQDNKGSKLDPEALKNVASIAGFEPNSPLGKYKLDVNTSVDADLQKALAAFDYDLRGKYELDSTPVAVGLLDLKTFRLAMLNPDLGQYSPGIPKLGVVLAYFQLHPEVATNQDSKIRSELGQIAKAANNELTAAYSQKLGLKTIQEVLNAHGLYNEKQGGLWVGKHYGRSDEIYSDPRHGLSHGATVRQLLNYFLLLEQGKLVSPEASKGMRELFESPDLPHHDSKFVKALNGRNLQIIRCSAAWANHHHDTAVITGSDRHYIMAVIANHLDGDGYVRDMAVHIDNLMKESASK